jgi:hypothetical protein
LKKLCLAAPLLILLGGCNPNKAIMPFLGKWSGSFEVSDMTRAGSKEDMKRESLKGFVQVYATNRSYKMEMSGEQETIAISGTWKIEANRITLNPRSIAIDDQGGADKRDPNKKFIPADQAQADYGLPLVLVESPDKKSLTGLKITIGALVGTHRFVKDSF